MGNLVGEAVFDEWPLVGELLLDGGEVDPGAFAADQAVGEVEDVQKAHLDAASAPFEPEDLAHRRRVQDRLVDDMVVAVPPPHGLEAFESKVREERSIEAGDLLAAWYTFDGDSRQAFREAMKVDEDTWIRARGWALSLTIIAIPYYRTRRPGGIREAQTFVAEILADFTG